MSAYHQSKAHAYWRKRVLIRAKGVCFVSGLPLVKHNRYAHHLWDASTYPQYREHVKKGVALRRKIHHIFHVEYMGGYQVSCTKEDFDNFVKDFMVNQDLFLNSGLI